ncbi:MAG: AAA family ATPase [Candidatus Sumerlaeia bacterium]|nr:AAA family ATPase [Candidatus Sumerlaeia bacterium]
MFTCVHLNQFIVFDSALIDFEPGFTVITGQTGAGKSVILQAIAILLGKSFPNGCVRQPAKKAELQGVLDLTEQPMALQWLQQQSITFEDPSQIIIRRELDDRGKQRSWINGTLLSQKALSEFGELLVLFTPQHLLTKLGESGFQRELFDAFAGCAPLAVERDALYQRYKSLKRQLLELQQNEQNALQRKEYLQHQLREFEEVGVDGLNYSSLMEKRDFHKKRQSRLESLARATALIDGSPAERGIMDHLGVIRRTLDQLQDELTLTPEELELYTEFERLLSQLSSRFSSAESRLQFAEEDPESVELAITRYKRLERKYGIGEEALQRKWTEIKEELNQLETSGRLIEELQIEVNSYKSKLISAERALALSRTQHFISFRDNVTEVLKNLELPNARFDVQLRNGTSDSGIVLQEPEFLFDANGTEPGAFAHKASGGELARLALALSVCSQSALKPGICLFDEIDTGMSGSTLHTMASVLKQLGNQSQVLLVTHQAIVSSQADQHLYVQKSHQSGHTTSQAVYLNHDEREREVSRLLDGGRSSQSIGVAKELLSQ